MKQDFTVSGYGDFPFDMLRFDECYPVDGESTAAIDPSTNDGKRRTVRLRSAKVNGCTPKRWDSFLWKVVSIEGRPL